MTKKEMTTKKYINHRQKELNKRLAISIAMNMLIVVLFMVNSVIISEKNKIEDEIDFVVPVYESIDHYAVISSANVIPEEITTTISEDLENLTQAQNNNFSDQLNEHDKYLLAKIIMAEVEGESLQSKILVANVILNRVSSNKFPDTVEEVIFQNNGKVYQFSPISNGRWDRVEPNAECYEAVEIALNSEYDMSEGALYFEACKNEDNWHSRNLTFICQSDSTRFYK